MRRYLDQLLRLRWALLALWLVTVVGSAWVYVSQFRIDNSVGIWFLADDPALQTYREHNRTFGENDWTFVLVETESIYDPEFLHELAEAVRRIESLADVERVVSIGNARDSDLDADDTLAYLPLLDPAGARPSVEEIAALRAQLEDSPVFVGNLIRPGDTRHTAVLIQNENRLFEQSPYRMQLVDAVRAILGEYATVQSVALAGNTAINAELNRAALRDMLVYYTLVSVFLVVSGFLFLKNPRDVAILLAVVTGSVVPVVGAIAALGVPVNIVTAMLPVVLVTISASVVIHLLNEFHHVRRGEEDQDALAAVLRGLFWPSLWTTLTTVVAFLSLALSDVVPLRQLGLAAAPGVAFSWVQTMVIAPMLIRLLWSGQSRRRRSRSRWVRAITRGSVFLVERRPAVVVIVWAILSASLAGLPRLEVDTDYVELFRAGSGMRADYDRIAAAQFPQYYVSVVLRFGPDRALTDVPELRRSLELEHAIAALPGVQKVLSAAQILREADRALAGERAPLDEFAQFGADRLGQLVLLVQASGNADLTDLLAGDRSETRLLVMTERLSMRRLAALRGQIDGLARTLLPADVQVDVTGTNVLWSNMDAEVTSTQITAMAIVLAAITLLLPLLFRSLALGLLGVLASFIPILFVLGLMGWLGIKINIATCIVGGVALGLAVDDTIYFLYRVTREVPRRGDLRRAVRGAMLVTGGAMVTTSLLLMGGFLTMSMSTFLPSADFGILFAATVLFALVGDMLVLPLLILRLPAGWRPRARAAAALAPITGARPADAADAAPAAGRLDPTSST
jgi:uncharacterized protein